MVQCCLPLPVAEHVLADPREDLTTAGQEFRARLYMVDSRSWGLATPCEGWSVRELTSHVGVGNQRTTYFLGGASHEEAAAKVDRDLVGEDPSGAFDWSLSAQARAFADEDALERPCETDIGEITGRQLLRFRILDLVLHRWDLSRAIGTNEYLDAVLVEHTWREIEPIVPTMGSMGVFGDGPSGTLPTHLHSSSCWTLLAAAHSEGVRDDGYVAMVHQ